MSTPRASADDASQPGDPTGRALPILLAGLGDLRRLRTGYPLALGTGDGLALPTGDWLAGLARGVDAAATRLVEDNLRRLEARLVAAPPDGGPEAPARARLAAAGEALLAELRLHPGPEASLRAALGRMVEATPPEARLLGYGPCTGLRILREASAAGLAAHRGALLARLAQTRAELAALVQVEAGRGDAARSPGAVGAALGDAAPAFLDPAAFAAVARRARPGHAEEPRLLERARAALDRLSQPLLAELPTLVVVHGGALPEGLDLGPGVRVSRVEDPLAGAEAAFDAQAGLAAGVLAAARAARLLLRWSYDPARHDALVEAFDWTDMSAEELLALPRVVAVERGERLAGPGLARLLELLRGDRPLQLLVELDPLAAARGSGLDLAALAVALDRPFVSQGTPARPEALLEATLRAVAHPGPALHLAASGFGPDGSEPPVGAWTLASAAVDARALPLLRYDPAAEALGRLDLGGNPQPEQAWPRQALGEGDGRAGPELAFSYADFCLLDPGLAAGFRRADPAEVEAGAPIDAWIGLDREARFARPPLVRGRAGGVDLALVVPPAVAAATAERARRWRILAELGGIDNRHARRAEEAARAEEREAAARREAELRVAHEAELERVRRETAAEALGRLAEALLATDFSAPVPAPRAARPAPTPALEAAPAAAAPAPAAPVEESGGFDDPFIDSVLCTACNDCINKNPMMFAYNANRQAWLKDPSAGSYRQLVEAAEKCPAKCIHPGKPKNLAEAGLDELVARAAPFNL